ncbi:uncharacterized protein LOC112513611 [Cynara cardunculus var. scolymus]|uniref:Oxidative stress 3 n=1 Tax=Cynara cardunculus var. scolymus TaxID=59895 RepID=A0A103Y5Q0_CYNCS|nr:uncharacterized protein LOC112513611 [Cynara cardunculus var. scolymus]KVI03014.1 hypothetical protein Ccrd_018691 [Cynara cardunculus var. scolymus]
MTMMEMGSSSLDQENKIKMMGYEDDDSFSSDVSSLVSSDDESDDEESNSSSGGGSSPPRTTALGDMSDLLQQLPSKRGLSKHFQGKSQSFTSLSKVMCLEDLAKPENPFNKKMKSCKSYVGLSRVLPPPTRSSSSSKLFNKKAPSRASCSSLSIGRNGSYLGLSNNSRPPTHPSHNNGACF